MPSATEYVESLSPWPKDGFGLERIKALLARVGDPQLRYPSIHVVGTNGKSTVTRTTEALLAGAGLSVGAYLSPHVRGWSERIRVRGEEADFEAAIERVRAEAEALEATQFEVLTAAALAEFAEAERRRRRRRGRARRTPRCDQRPSFAGSGADERRAGAHGSARDDARGDRR